MPAAKRQKTRGDKIADLVERPITNDFDPEDSEPGLDEDSSAAEEDGVDGFDGREHYEKVGKSKLRKAQTVSLGPQYTGFKVKRKRLGDEEQDLHDPFAEYSDTASNDGTSVDGDDVFEDGSGDPDAKDSEGDDEDQAMEDMRSESDEDIDDGDEDLDGDAALSEDQNPKQNAHNERAELRRILQTEQQGLASTLAESQRTDAVKGAAVNQQRKAFGALLQSRIRLQKGLDAMSGFPASAATVQDEDMQSTVEAAEAAARKLWSSLDSLRCTLASSRAGSSIQQRGDPTASLPTLWSHMRSLDNAARPRHRAILDKWSVRTQKASTSAAKTSTNRLNLNGTSGQTSLLDVLDAQLADLDRSVPDRNTEAEDNLDDPDFYNLVVKDLVDHRDADQTTTGPSSNFVPGAIRPAALAPTGQKKIVDTRASKGRKMRFTVHDKLLNFMVPDDRGSWSEKAARELFGSLFGAKMANGVNGEAQTADEGNEEAALRLFRS